jgi:non-heme chloroperoxidase
VSVLLDAGYRVIPYDRRGFGDSSQPTSGYNYDTFAEDLHTFVTRLDLRDAALVGFSMGGGVDGSVFDGIKHGIAANRLAFLSRFHLDFYNVDILGGRRVSEQVVQFSWNIAACASPRGTLDCVEAWLTDFRKDLPRIDVPTLVVHGDADRILPLAATGQRTHEAVKGSRLVVVEVGPPGLTWTHAEQVNRELLDFLAQGH